MDVLPEVLSPGVQDHGDAEFTTEPAGSVTEFLQGPGCCLEEQPVDESRLHLRKGVELMGESEHHVPVVDIEQIGTLLLDPSGLRERLALGTVPVPARCILDRYRATLAALGLETTECGGPTGHQVAHDPSPSERERVCLAIGVDPCVQDIGHLQCRPLGRHWRACMCHRSGVGVRKFQQVERRCCIARILPCDMQVPHRRGDRAVTKTALNDR